RGARNRAPAPGRNDPVEELGAPRTRGRRAAGHAPGVQGREGGRGQAGAADARPRTAAEGPVAPGLHRRRELDGVPRAAGIGAGAGRGHRPRTPGPDQGAAGHAEVAGYSWVSSTTRPSGSLITTAGAFRSDGPMRTPVEPSSDTIAPRSGTTNPSLTDLSGSGAPLGSGWSCSTAAPIEPE